jgi:signal transduction histidine kinase
VAVLGDRRQLVSAMHALLENAVTYSYDDSTVACTGTVVNEPLFLEPEEAALSGSGSGPSVAVAAPGTPLPAAPSFETAGPPVADSPAPRPEPESSPVEGDGVFTRECVRLTVSDHGIGIPARDLDRIFERFYRVDHGRSRDTGGTGLGLSIVRHVASNHQGWVDVESREGEGSTFTLVLPLQPERNL